MHNLSNNNFWKLYRYYFHKLLKKWYYWLISLIYAVVIYFQLSDFIIPLLKETEDWKKYFLYFWIISLAQLFLLLLSVSDFVGLLTGFTPKFSFKWSIPKRDNCDDARIVSFVSGITRQRIAWSKFFAVFTHSFIFNFLFLTLPLSYQIFTSLNLIMAFSFLLANGLLLAVINCFFLLSYYFLLYENFSIFFLTINTLIIGIIGLLVYFYWKIILEYPLICPITSIFLMLSLGYFFNYLYRKDFDKRDLD